MHPGDVLFVPPGVPHHFTQMNGFRAWLMRFDTLGLRANHAGACCCGARGRRGTGRPRRRRRTRRGATGAETVHRQDDVLDGGRHRRALEGERGAEADQLALFDGPANISANVRIVNCRETFRRRTKAPRTSGS